jgi:ribose-phosphate pyrophosphokinase
LGIKPGSCSVEHFPDGELHAEVGPVRGRDVFILQPLAAPVGESMLEAALLADACRRAGARTVTAVAPYLGYARQDCRVTEGAPLGAHVVAQLLSASSLDRLIVIDLHTAAVEGFFACPVEHLGAGPVLAGAIAPGALEGAVLVAPDFGAAKRARSMAARLGLPFAVVHKTRVSQTDVVVRGVVGDVRKLRPIILDDMISTGATIAAAVEALIAAGADSNVTVAATHGLFADPACRRLEALSLSRILVTDTLPPREGFPLPIEVVSVAPLLADAIGRLVRGEALAELLMTC